jgi:hypothetical protein
MKRNLLLATALAASRLTSAALELGAPFADHAVLQRQAPVPVWGWSKPGTEVLVAEGPMIQSYSVRGNKLIVEFDNADGGLVVAETASNRNQGLEGLHRHARLTDPMTWRRFAGTPPPVPTYPCKHSC